MSDFDRHDHKTEVSITGEMTRDSEVNGEGITRLTLSFLEQQASLKAFISRFVRRPQDVDDIAQETFIRAIKAEKKNEIEFPRAYIYRIARNLAFEFLSKKHVKLTNYIDDCALDELAVPTSDVENTIAVN